MGTDDAADACRGVAEAVRDAGINGIALSSHQVIRLTVNGQHDLTFQYGAYLLTLMLNSLPGRGSRLVSFKNHRQRTVRISVMNQLHGNALTSHLNQVILINDHLGFVRLFGFRKEFRERQPIDFQQLLQRTDGRTDFVLLYGADGTMCQPRQFGGTTL